MLIHQPRSSFRTPPRRRPQCEAQTPPSPWDILKKKMPSPIRKHAPRNHTGHGHNTPMSNSATAAPTAFQAEHRTSHNAGAPCWSPLHETCASSPFGMSGQPITVANTVTPPPESSIDALRIWLDQYYTSRGNKHIHAARNGGRSVRCRTSYSLASDSKCSQDGQSASPHTGILQPLISVKQARKRTATVGSRSQPARATKSMGMERLARRTHSELEM